MSQSRLLFLREQAIQKIDRQKQILKKLKKWYKKAYGDFCQTASAKIVEGSLMSESFEAFKKVEKNWIDDSGLEEEKPVFRFYIEKKASLDEEIEALKDDIRILEREYREYRPSPLERINSTSKRMTAPEVKKNKVSLALKMLPPPLPLAIPKLVKRAASEPPLPVHVSDSSPKQHYSKSTPTLFVRRADSQVVQPKTISPEGSSSGISSPSSAKTPEASPTATASYDPAPFSLIPSLSR